MLLLLVAELTESVPYFLARAPLLVCLFLSLPHMSLCTFPFFLCEDLPSTLL